jgi:hypothetical protein
MCGTFFDIVLFVGLVGDGSECVNTSKQSLLLLPLNTTSGNALVEDENNFFVCFGLDFLGFCIRTSKKSSHFSFTSVDFFVNCNEKFSIMFDEILFGSFLLLLQVFCLCLCWKGELKYFGGLDDFCGSLSIQCGSGVASSTTSLFVWMVNSSFDLIFFRFI